MLDTKGWLASYDEATVSFGVHLYLYVTMYIWFYMFCSVFLYKTCDFYTKCTAAAIS